MKKYDLVNVKGFECYYLGSEDGYDKYLCKNCLTAEQLQKYGDGDELMICDNEVRFQDNIRNKDFEKSCVKSVILNNMAEDLYCEVDLLSKEEWEELDKEKIQCDNWYWLKTYDDDIYARVFGAGGGSGAHTHSNVVTATYGVRPVIKLESNNLKEKLEELEKEIKMLKERLGDE